MIIGKNNGIARITNSTTALPLSFVLDVDTFKESKFRKPNSESLIVLTVGAP